MLNLLYLQIIIVLCPYKSIILTSSLIPLFQLTIPFISFYFREIKALQEIEDNQNVCDKFSYLDILVIIIHIQYMSL